MPKKQPNKARRKPKRQPTPPKFAIGDPVRVKASTPDPTYPDIPIGGWAGSVAEVEEGFRAATYRIEWNQRTLDAMHPIYRNRCERDHLGRESVWLSEADIEPDTGDPVPIEQPTHIITRPLNPKDQDDRIRAIFGLTSDDPLPDATEETLAKYHHYLNEKLTFPFEATIEEDIGPFQTRANPVTVTALLDDFEEDEGLLCKASASGEPVELPLTDLIRVTGPNRQPVEDYGYWFVNSGDGSQVGTSSIPSEPLRPLTLLNIVVTLALLGGFYGTTLGATWAAVEGGAVAVKVGAILVGLFLGLFGAAFGPVFGPTAPRRRGSRLGGLLGAFVGTLVGGLLGAMLIAFVGALIGALVGGLVGQVLRRKTGRPVFWFLVGGAMIGVLVQAWLIDAEAAWAGAWKGAVTGVVAGPILFFGWTSLLASLMKEYP